MKPQTASIRIQTDSIRAGMISLLVPATFYLWITGLGDLARMWLFIISFAICFVLMMQSVVDLLVLVFASASKSSGSAVGHLVRFARRSFRCL
jgi:hypothetical protein